MFGIRQKLSLGFGGLLVIIAVIGTQSITQLTRLGLSIDVILRENYRSVIACQQMKEALERMDSGALFTLLGDTEEGAELISRNEPVFEEALQVESNNITLSGEAEKAAHIRDLYTQYKSALLDVQDPTASLDVRKKAYFTRLLPLFQQIKDAADAILQMNQKSMSDANTRAFNAAMEARGRMYLFVVLGALVAVGFMLFIGRWILHPINRLIHSADEIKQGNLHLVVKNDSRDEIGRLSKAFNEMASSLRELRRNARTKMERIERSTQQVFKSLPDAAAVVDLEGRVEVSTDAAGEIFGLGPDVRLGNLSLDWLGDLFDEAVRSGRAVEAQNSRPLIQRFVKGEEHYFSPEAVPILDSDRRVTGVILIVKDVTQQRQQDELKRGVISTVSHQLKTPLTSLRMATYLLLEEKAGPLTPKQAELLIAARDDSDRLHSILTNLLDISRIESGRMQMDYRAVPPHEIVLEQVESYRSTAQDRGVAFYVKVPDDLPEVWADPTRIGHVLDNLLSNAFKYTSPGGQVTVSAQADQDMVRFSVLDTGKGIHARYLDRIFEQFFRVPDQEGGETGEGLGLAIAKEIVEAHGGTIHAESEEGGGSTFTFSLKRADRVLQ